MSNDEGEKNRGENHDELQDALVWVECLLFCGVVIGDVAL